MKMIEFTRDMRPQRAGEKRVVTDAIARRLIETGAAKHVISTFDGKAEQALPTSQSTSKPYRTRKRNVPCPSESSQLF
jgi:hypothetical protein